MLNIKCPECGHIMSFDVPTGMLTCSHCSHSTHITHIDLPEYGSYKNSSYVKELAGIKKPAGNDSSNVPDMPHGSHINDGRAPDDTTIKSTLNDVSEISAYIPFEVSKEDALRQLRLWAGRRLFTSGSFNSALKSADVAMEYYPAFLFDVSAAGELHAVCTKNDDDPASHITRTHYYDVCRRSDIQHNMILLSATDALSDIVLDDLLPYDYGKLRKYEKGAAPAVHKVTKKSSLLYENVKTRLTKQMQDALWNSLDDYSSKHNAATKFSIYDLDISVILIPVWHLCLSTKNMTSHIYMNGINKNIFGRRPLSLFRMISCSVISGLILFLVIMFAIITFL